MPNAINSILWRKWFKILSLLKLFQRGPVDTCWNKTEMHVDFYHLTYDVKESFKNV